MDASCWRQPTGLEEPHERGPGRVVRLRQGADRFPSDGTGDSLWEGEYPEIIALVPGVVRTAELIDGAGVAVECDGVGVARRRTWRQRDRFPTALG